MNRSDNLCVAVTPLGGAREIGASSTLVEAGGLAVVVDFGARPGASEDAYPSMSEITKSDSDIAALILTHAHYDHTGGVPILHRLFPDMPVWGTRPTLRLTDLLLHDSAKIQSQQEGCGPDFDEKDVDSLHRVYRTADFDTPTLIAANDSVAFSAQFVRAGHILGAAVVVLDIADLENERLTRVVISGDVSTHDQPTLRGTDVQRLRNLEPDLLILEGTYGVQAHEPMPREEARLVQDVAAVIRRGGRVVIPAFAVGRAQTSRSFCAVRKRIRRPFRMSSAIRISHSQRPRSTSTACAAP